jgi:hypothetical protein
MQNIMKLYFTVFKPFIPMSTLVFIRIAHLCRLRLGKMGVCSIVKAGIQINMTLSCSLLFFFIFSSLTGYSEFCPNIYSFLHLLNICLTGVGASPCLILLLWFHYVLYTFICIIQIYLLNICLS